MAQNAFAGQAKRPTAKALEAVLGQSHALWKVLVIDLKRELKLDVAEWHTSSVKLGWSFRLQRNQRNIVYLGPRDRSFVAAFVLGDKAIAAARSSKFPPDVQENIAHSKRYAEGTAVRIEVKTVEDVDTVKALARIKLQF
ncbi:MAG TPA: DUF3788 family protein [Verrucomicrobiae bacterium]|nr:DUF3788 family protein [Verrucomicrobiae bacterium]